MSLRLSNLGGCCSSRGSRHTHTLQHQPEIKNIDLLLLLCKSDRLLLHFGGSLVVLTCVFIQNLFEFLNYGRERRYKFKI